MSRRLATFHKVDVSRAINGVKDAGLDVARVEVDAANGKIVIIPGKAEQVQRENEWDEVE